MAKSIEGAEIVSADSRQIYRGMDIATAKPTATERAAARHHCLDLADPDESFSAADYQRHATSALEAIAQRGGIALLVGGTGLYLRSIARGLPLDSGDVNPELRAELQERLEEAGLGVLMQELQERDPAGAATIDAQNPRRVLRALERAIISGTATPPAARGYPAPLVWLGLRLEPERHRTIIETRVRQHFADGLLDEADRLRGSYPESLPAFSAMGYREAFDVLAGRSSIDEAKATDARRTWAYVRRQRTWFRSEADISWLDADDAIEDRARMVVAPLLERIGRSDYAGPR